MKKEANKIIKIILTICISAGISIFIPQLFAPGALLLFSEDLDMLYSLTSVTIITYFAIFIAAAMFIVMIFLLLKQLDYNWWVLYLPFVQAFFMTLFFLPVLSIAWMNINHPSLLPDDLLVLLKNLFYLPSVVIALSNNISAFWLITSISLCVFYTIFLFILLYTLK